ncbi:GntR family transcriptional regulator [Gelria sp. Kuro-4]|uniref:GntR family transcriptional regulator n=1 Tax=Gelria sp. Kuro-4 TaxID=2796927 RepID=UPI001BF0474A|nr:GntR family transcriptional regulator [Gelria sp. Kuro-4]BCV24894.1 GntR family transcriptional regulator [Gelria sp. Kuro-4]
MEVIKNKTMMEAAYDTLRKAIVTGHFKPGEQLIETDLIEWLQVSRTPLREALRRLETEKLVVSRPYKGVFVNQISKEYAEQLYQVQSILEGLAARLATQHRTPEFLVELRELTRQAVQRKQIGDYEGMIDKTYAFHQAIWRQSSNEVLLGVLETLQAQIHLLRGTTLLDPDRSEENLYEHEKILDALSAGSCDTAQALMSEHINNAACAAIRIFRQRREQESPKEVVNGQT